MNLSNILILIATVLFVWAAFIIGFELDYGNAAFIGLMGAAAFAAGHLPWANRNVF